MLGFMDEWAPRAEEVVRATPSPTLANDWSLVLASAGITHRLVEGGGAFSLIVSAGDLAAASAALAAYDAESATKAAPPAPDTGSRGLGIMASVALGAMLFVTGAADAQHPTAWFAVGQADAAKILHGEWWRALTAVTLHENLIHLVGNVIACLVFVSAVGRWLGAGAGALAILGCAWAANMLTALWHRHDDHFVSLGASTATFAAMGLVAGLQLWRRWRWDQRRRYFWLPLGAGLALFAMTGTSANADFGAHLFGLGTGAAAGTALAASGLRAPGRVGQALLFAVVSAVLIGAWLLAFRTSGRALP
jgi:membrane associated rhomboid family serine protease